MASLIKTPTDVPAYLLILLYLLVPISAHADTDKSAEYISEKAQQAFAQKNYHSALTLYEKLARIDNDESVQFNIGVCLYKLGQWDEAASVFLTLYENDNSDELSLFNLALTEEKRNKLNTAKEYYDIIFISSESDALALIASERSAKIESVLGSHSNSERIYIEKKNANPANNGKRWFVYASLNYGSDDNVVSFVDDSVQTGSDYFHELVISPTWYSSSDLNNSWIINGSYFQSNYTEQNDYDVDVAALSIRKNISINRQNRVHAALQVDKSAVGGVEYLQSTSLNLGGRYLNQRGLRIRYGLRFKNSTESKDRFSAFAGDSLRGQISLHQSINKHRFGLSFSQERDDKNDRVGDTSLEEDTLIFSANRSTLVADWLYGANTWSLKAYYNIRESRFSDENISFLNDTLLPERVTRSDSRTLYGLSYSKTLNEFFSFDAELQNIDNGSNIESYDYNQQTISAGISVQF